MSELLSRNRLVFKQKTKLIEVNQHYKIKDEEGNDIGEIVQEGQSTDHEVGRITKTWEGLARTMFTTADHYFLEVDPSVQGKLRLLALASASAIDLALKQDSRGLS
jgi:hypothetical protein